MSTTTTSSNSLQFNPTSMQTYGNFLNTAGPALTDMAQNPFNNQYFNQGKSFLNNQAIGLGQRGMSTLMSNAKQSGFSNMPGFLQGMMAKQGRATSGLQAQGLWNMMQQANQNRNFSLGTMMGFQPLLTGSTSTSKTGGTGTWLPQLLWAGLSAALAFGTGGASLAGSAMGGGMSGSTAMGGSNPLGAGSGIWSGGGIGSGTSAFTNPAPWSYFGNIPQGGSFNNFNPLLGFSVPN